VVKLEHEPDVSVAELDQIRIAYRRERAPRHLDDARVGAIETAKQMQQRALADARRAHDREHLALFDREIQVAKHVDALRAEDVELVQIVDGDERHQRVIRT
jgi:hypothetical protein